MSDKILANSGSEEISRQKCKIPKPRENVYNTN